ncbi:MAG: D-glycerate dehydrogenase [Chloroflexi bacterium]|nr:D-glycerate dehydrogenase [Chloroflexota bacterium]
MDLLCVDETHNALSLAGPAVAAVVTDAAPVDAALLKALPNLKAVVKLGRNYSNVDAQAVRGRGLVFASVPRKGPNCVAELAMTLILALSKDLLIMHESVISGAYRLRGLKPELTSQRKHAFQWMAHARLHEVRGKTVGIIGMGEIGFELALRAHVMGMRITYHKRTPLSPELEQRTHAEYRELNTLLAESDYVYVTVPLTPETDKLIGREQLAMMKPSAYLVNTCRGGVVDEDALIEALATCQIAGAGLDVFTYEPLPFDSPLCDLDNVILMPHIGGGTGSARLGELAVGLEEVQRILAGEPPAIDLR